MTSGRGWVLNTSFMFADWSENLGIAKYLVLSRSMDQRNEKDQSTHICTIWTLTTRSPLTTSFLCIDGNGTNQYFLCQLRSATGSSKAWKRISDRSDP
jgi:hypothetical protein